MEGKRCSSDETARGEIFQRISNARTLAEAQQIALEMWHDMNATQEGFICRGCANCEFCEEPLDVPPRSSV